MLNEWVGRMYRRGNDSKFIQFIIDNWDDFMLELWNEDNHGFGTHYLSNNEYLDLPTLDFLYNW